MLPRIVVAFALLGVLAPGVVRADDDDDAAITYRKLRFAERTRTKKVVVSGSFTDVFDADLLDKLDSGFTTTVVLRAYVYKEDDEDGVPIAFTAATFRVVYDLWEEIYEIQIRDARGERNFTRASQAEALKAVTTLDAFPVVDVATLTEDRNYFLGVIVEVNPVSEELLAEVRRWLGKEGGKGVAGSSSFFGSFVSVFVNPKIPEADRTLKFRSQPFFMPRKK